jgi:hypothetical protein
MAIPPIISGFPLFRIFRTDRSGNGAADKAPAAGASPAGDTVQISDAAQKKLAAAQVLNAQDPGKIQAATGQVRQFLEQNPVSLGLDPAFAE